MRDYTFNCETCGKSHTKRIPPSREDNLPRFCSNECRFKGQETDRSWVEFDCSFCGKHDKKYAPPSIANKITEWTCSPSCGAKAARRRRGNKILSEVEYTCLNCGIVFTKKERSNGQPYLYCTKECSDKSDANRKHNGYGPLLERLTKDHGHERALQLLEDHKAKRSRASTESNTGRVLTETTRQKISVSCTGIPNVLKGKTFEEFYGPERGKELADQHSKTLLEGFASGRLAPPTVAQSRRHIVGTYKGFYFRSSYEYAFMKMKEAEGFTLGTDVLYEPRDLRVPYEFGGLTHTYFPDFHVVPERTVYEVKPEGELFNDEVVAKACAAELLLGSMGLGYRFITEVDLGVRLTREQVGADPDVMLVMSE